MNALNPLVRVDDQIAEPLVVHRNVDAQSALKVARNSLTLVGIPENRFRAYPHELSGGMKQRAAIAMALSLEPKIVILDEPVTALDVVVQRRIIDLIKQLREQLGVSFICISHDITLLAEICDRLAVMYAGKIVDKGETSNLSKPHEAIENCAIWRLRNTDDTVMVNASSDLMGIRLAFLFLVFSLLVNSSL